MAPPPSNSTIPDSFLLTPPLASTSPLSPQNMFPGICCCSCKRLSLLFFHGKTTNTPLSTRPAYRQFRSKRKSGFHPLYWIFSLLADWNPIKLSLLRWYSRDISVFFRLKLDLVSIPNSFCRRRKFNHLL